MKKITSLLLLFTLVLVGCGDDGTTELTIWAWDANFNVPIAEEAGRRYMEENPEVVVTVEEFAQDDIVQKLHVNLSSGSIDALPDIVLIEDYKAQMFLETYPEAFVPLTEYFNWDDFVDSKVEAVSYEGEVYAVPFDSGVTGMFYRVDYIENAGYTEEDMWYITWEEYIEIGIDVMEANEGVSMFASDFYGDSGLIRIMINSVGEWYYDEEGNVSLADNEAMYEALEIHKAIDESGIDKKVNGWDEWIGSAYDGSVATYVTGAWVIGSLELAEDQSGLWRVAPIPTMETGGGDNYYSNLGGSSWYVINGTGNEMLAIDFLQSTFGSDVEFYEYILIEHGAIGSYIPAYESEAYNEEIEFFGGQQVYKDLTEWAVQVPQINYGVYNAEVESAIESVIYDYIEGDLTTEEALIEMEDYANNLIGN